MNRLKRNLESLGHEVRLKSCEEHFDINSDANHDIVGIVFPIHSSYAPSLLESIPFIICEPLIQMKNNNKNTIQARTKSLKKIYIVGIVGAVKTTFSRNLSRKLNIHSYEIDEIAYKQTEKGRVKQSDEEQIATFKRLNEKHIWIIEGTYRPSCQYLLENADTIIFLDPPLYVRKIRIIKRFLKQQLGIETSPYKSDLKQGRAYKYICLYTF